MNFKPYLLHFWNLWPPLFFTGIKIVEVSKDYRQIKVRLKLRFWNSNYVGTQYGGSIFSMADPFYMVMLMKNLGTDYSVWDKASKIRFLKPGRTDLFADFDLSEEDLKIIKEQTNELGKIEWIRKVSIKDKNGEVVADIEKTISIKKKESK